MRNVLNWDCKTFGSVARATEPNVAQTRLLMGEGVISPGGPQRVEVRRDWPGSGKTELA